ncbi:MAG: hypothetical protein HY650_01700 [Acidobacteria bacterium]|nr:hypothetical protein [Acidobacteriota bacterium]
MPHPTAEMIRRERSGRKTLDELNHEELWAKQFRASEDALGRLAAEVRVDRAAGRTTALDPEKL